MVKLTVIGNLGKDCTVNKVNGKNVINFSVASTEKFKDNTGAQREKTTWVECGYWTDNTGISPYLKKGTQVYVEGTADIRSYETKDGKQGVSLTCKVFQVKLLGSAQGTNQDKPAQEATPQETTTNNKPSAGDLPF